MAPVRRAVSASLVLLPLAHALAGATPPPPRPDSVAAVAAGRLKVARASWWGFDATDATAALQAAINSGVPKLIVDNVGERWVCDKIRLVSNQEIVFERGVEVIAKRGAFRDPNDSLFTAQLLHDVTLRGYGATLRMWRSDYAKPPYQKGEWRMVLDIESCTNVRVYGLTLAESGGDGIYLGTAKAGVPNRNVHIKDVVCDRNYRQGISVINALGLVIENTVMQYTSGTAPMAGIDFEPNGPTEAITCVMRDCTTRGNSGCGYALYIPALNAKSHPFRLRMEGCRSLGDAGDGLYLATGNGLADAVAGSLDLVGCSFRRSGGTGITIQDKPADRWPVRVERTSVLDCARRAPSAAPIMLLSSRAATRGVGGIEFIHAVVRDPLKRRPIAYRDVSTGVGVSGVTGDLVLASERPPRALALTPALVDAWMPCARVRPYPPYPLKDVRLRPVSTTATGPLSPDAALLRGTGAWVLYARRGEAVRFGISHEQVGPYSGSPIPVVVRAPSGAEVVRALAAFQAVTQIAFSAAETGLYTVTCDPGANRARTAGSTHPISVDGRGGAVPLISTVGTFYFGVPAGVREFAVVVRAGDAGEWVKASLIDPAGRVVQEADNIDAVKQMAVALPVASGREVWGVRLERPSQQVMEDLSVELQGVPPFLAGSPETVLVPEGKWR